MIITATAIAAGTVYSILTGVGIGAAAATGGAVVTKAVINKKHPEIKEANKANREAKKAARKAKCNAKKAASNATTTETTESSETTQEEKPEKVEGEVVDSNLSNNQPVVEKTEAPKQEVKVEPIQEEVHPETIKTTEAPKQEDQPVANKAEDPKPEVKKEDQPVAEKTEAPKKEAKKSKKSVVFNPDNGEIIDK